MGSNFFLNENYYNDIYVNFILLLKQHYKLLLIN
jgi:hypothetical protein